MELLATTFGLGLVSGIGVNVWFCAQLKRLRGPRYYHRRARRVAREWV